MACGTVGQFSKMAVDLREKCGDEGRSRTQIAEVAIDLGRDLGRVGVRAAVALQQPSQIRKPHASRNAFAGDVSVHGKNTGVRLREHRKVPGKETGGEDFA